jgi:type II secretory pathway pseudopilin PulG
VLVVIVVFGIIALLLMLGLTRSREVARSATCSRNLQQIGVALGLYEQATGQLPYVDSLRGMEASSGGPLALMLDQFGVPGLDAIDPGAEPPSNRSGEPAVESYVPGFVCPSDPIATSRAFPAPVNYRANTGNRTEGRLGPFAPGASVTLAEVEAGHGASYTAAFSERLVGTADSSPERIRDYRLVPGPIPQGGCPEAPDGPLRPDAGRSWRELGWRSTLYSHASPPGSRSSCIAEDGRTASMGASSGHVEGVRVLLLDGSVRTYSPSVALPVWQALGSDRDDPEAPGDDASPD